MSNEKEKEKNDLLDAIVNKLKDEKLTREEIQEKIQRNQELLRKNLEAQEQILKASGRLNDAHVKRINLLKEQMRFNADLLKQQEGMSDAEMKDIDEISQKYIDLLELREKGLEKLGQGMDGLAEKIGIAATESNNAFIKAFDNIGDYVTGIAVEMAAELDENVGGGSSIWKGMKMALKDIGAVAAQTFSPFNVGTSILQSVVQSTIAMVKSVDEAASSIAAATGAGDKFTPMLANMSTDMLALGIDAKDTAGAISSLQFGFTNISKVSVELQESLTQTVASLSKLGVSGDESTAILNDLQLSFGKSADEAEMMLRQIAMSGVEIGITTKKMLSDLRGSLPVLAMYGDKAEGVFKGVAAAAKAAGVETSELINIAEGFQTFSDAADKAGQLNAILGTQFSTVGLLSMEHDDLIKTLIEEVQVTTGGFENLGKFEKRAIAAAAGITDMNVANKIFSMSISDYEDYEDQLNMNQASQEKLAEAVMAASPALDRLKMAFLELAVELEPMVMGFKEGVTSLALFIKENKGLIIVLGTVLTVMGAIRKTMMIMIGIRQAQAAMITAEIMLKGRSAVASSLLAKQDTALAGAKRLLGISTYFAYGAFGLMALAVGGLAFLLFKKRSSPTFYQGIFIIAAGIALMGVASKLAGPKFIGVALAAATMAGAFALMYQGVAGMLDKLGELGVELVSFSVGMAGLGGAFAAIGSGALVGSVGILSMYFAVALLSKYEKTIVGLGQFFHGLSVIKTDNLDLIAQKIKMIAEAIKDIPDSHVVAITALTPVMPKLVGTIGTGGEFLKALSGRDSSSRPVKTSVDVNVNLDGKVFEKAVTNIIHKNHKSL